MLHSRFGYMDLTALQASDVCKRRVECKVSKHGVRIFFIFNWLQGKLLFRSSSLCTKHTLFWPALFRMIGHILWGWRKVHTLTMIDSLRHLSPDSWWPLLSDLQSCRKSPPPPAHHKILLVLQNLIPMFFPQWRPESCAFCCIWIIATHPIHPIGTYWALQTCINFCDLVWLHGLTSSLQMCCLITLSGPLSLHAQ